MSRSLFSTSCKLTVGAGILALLSACSVTRTGIAVPRVANEPLVKGPAVMDVVTPFDNALSCLDGRINKEALRFSVGAILDATGKEQITDGGSGKFITQGAGDIVQSALFKAGATVVNRRDPRIIENEMKWGLLDSKKQEFSTFFITGSINSLDFLPGSGIDVQIAGVGPRFRQNRILVGLDLSLTETRSGKIVANIPLQKQVVATEDGFGVGRFFGNTLVSLDVGGKEREALNLVLRQMLNLATFELLTQVMNPTNYADCMQMVEAVDGVTDNSVSKRKLNRFKAEQAKLAAAQSDKPAPAVDGAAKNDAATAAPQAASAPTGSSAGTPARSEPNGADNQQGAYFREEESKPNPAALAALELRSRDTTKPTEAGASAGESGLATALPAGNQDSGNAAAPCTFQGEAFPQVTPLRASGPGDSLSLTSRVSQVICLTDASGQFKSHQLQANLPLQLKGASPWRLQAEQLDELEILYQGFPLRKPGYVKDRMELLERQ